MSLMDPTQKELARKLPRRNVKKWGEIRTYPVIKAVVVASCRRCGTHGEFDTRQDQKVFEDYHNGRETGGKCPEERNQIY